MMETLEHRLRETLRQEADRLPDEQHVRTITVSSRRPSRLPSALVAPAAALLVLLIAAPALWLATRNGGQQDPATSGSEPNVSQADTGTLITSEQILEDGVVTEEEYRTGALAVVACLTEAGFEAEVNFEEPNPGTDSLQGHAEFWVDHSDDATESATNAFDKCQDLHLSHNVSLGWSAALGQLDLDELREETTAVTQCVEQRTGQDFGELTYDRFGYLTDQGQQTKDAAFEYQDHQPWQRCQNDLGYHEDYKADTRALLECVEERAGKDFGELTFDETGHADEESQQTLRAAMDHQDHQIWETCQEELGIQTSQRVTSDR